VVGDGVDELSEVLTDWQINQDVLEQTDEIIGRKRANTL